MKYIKLYENYKSDIIYTDVFKNWFGDWENSPETSSKILNDRGEPMVLYHGSNKKFDIFFEEKQLIGWLGKGFYFTDDKSLSKQYGRYIKKVYLNIRNPFYVDGNSPSDIYTEVNKKYNTNKDGITDVSILLKLHSHDGIFFNHWEQGNMYCCYNSEQIKTIN